MVLDTVSQSQYVEDVRDNQFIVYCNTFVVLAASLLDCYRADEMKCTDEC